VKPFLCLFFFSTAILHAHDHVDVGLDPGNPHRLYLLGPRYQEQESLYVPRGEPFSFDMPKFPGGWFASELTFATDLAADPWIEIVSVTGPEGGSFSFWEVEALEPTWSRTTGWTLGQGIVPSFPVIYFGESHQHGRAFTMDTPGSYSITFRAVDPNPNSGLVASQEKTIIFQALPPPQLSIRMENGQVVISFLSRLNFLYDLQVSTDLSSGAWDSVVVDFIDGDGTVKETSLTLEHPRAFFRLVEF
jgi:hypothetical protein